MSAPTDVSANVAGSELAPTEPHRTGLDRLNPVTRLMIAFMVAIPILLTLDWVSATAMLVSELVLFTGLGERPLQMLRRLLPVFPVAGVAALSMVLYGRPGGAMLWHWGLIIISERSITMAIAVFIRIFALALSAIVLTGSLDATRLADGLAQILHLPARLVLGALAGVRMIGLFVDDWQTLGLARRARGLGDQGRLRRWFGMAFALLVFAIRRGTVLATSMEARGFNAVNARHRTWARPSRLGRIDLLALLVALMVCVAVVAVAIWAGTFWIVFTEPPN